MLTEAVIRSKACSSRSSNHRGNGAFHRLKLESKTKKGVNAMVTEKRWKYYLLLCNTTVGFSSVGWPIGEKWEVTGCCIILYFVQYAVRHAELKLCIFLFEFLFRSVVFPHDSLWRNGLGDGDQWWGRRREFSNIVAHRPFQKIVKLANSSNFLIFLINFLFIKLILVYFENYFPTDTVLNLPGRKPPAVNSYFLYIKTKTVDIPTVFSDHWWIIVFEERLRMVESLTLN